VGLPAGTPSRTLARPVSGWESRPVSRRRRLFCRQPRLHECLVCHADCVVPVSLEDLGEDSHRLLLRCAQCETYCEIVVGAKRLAAYMAELRHGLDDIAASLREIEREPLHTRADVFLAGG
jgi:hypothetical protein